MRTRTVRAWAIGLVTLAALMCFPTISLATTWDVAVLKWTPHGNASSSKRTTIIGDRIDADLSTHRVKVVANRKTKYYLPVGPTAESDTLPHANWSPHRVSRNSFFKKMRNLHYLRGCHVRWVWARIAGHRVRLVTRIQYAFIDL